MLSQVVDIFKLRIGLLMAITALAGFAVTPGPDLAAWQIAVLALTVLGASASAGAFNQFVERDIDALMNRTKNRPFVTGAVEHQNSWLWLIAALLIVSVGVTWWLFNKESALYVFLGAFFYGVVYTLWLKRRTWLNIVIGGASGSFAVLAGAAASDPGLTPLSVILAVVLFLWTPPHFWALAIAIKEDYQRANVPMLPVVKGDLQAAKIILLSTILLVLVSLLPFYYGLGWFYLTGAFLGGSYFIYKAVLLVITPSKSTAMSCFFASLVQLSVLLMVAIVDAVYLA
jgi:protoheme IX farnesyltransferase